MAALVVPTDAPPGVSAFDLCATDFWSRPAAPTTLVYNGRAEPAALSLPLPPGGPFDVYDAVEQVFVARGVRPPTVRVTVAPDAAAVYVAVPAGAPLVRDVERNWLLAGGVVIDWQLVSRAQ